MSTPSVNPQDPAGDPTQPAPPSAGATPAPSRAKAAGGAVLKRILGVLVVVGIGIAFAIFRASGATAPKVGECIDHVGGNEIKVVACTDPAAEMKVVGVVGNQSEAQFDSDESCKAFPEHMASYFESGGRGVSNGYVLCLAEK